MTSVLVIDDNYDFRKLALLWFQIHGIDAEGAANGAQGLEMQRKRPATVVPSRGSSSSLICRRER